MGTIASLIVRIGAQDTEISAALEKLVGNARRADADLSKLGSTPLAQKAIADTEKLAANIVRITDAQQAFADKAVNAAVGVETLGGASKLMSGQLDEVARTINKGIDAFRALGQEAPKDLQRVSDAVSAQQEALKKAAAAHASFGDAQQKSGVFTNALAGAQTALITQLAAVAGPAALGFAAKAALDYADNLVKLSDRTGIGIVALQRLGAIAEASGNSLEDIAGAVNKFQKNIQEGSPAAVAAIQRIGVSINDLLKQSPDEQFITIAKAIQRIPDPATQAAIAMEIFGKSGAQLLPTLKGDIDKLADSTVKMSAESVKALDDFGDALGQLKTSAVNIAGEILAAFLKTAQGVKDAAKAVLEAGSQGVGKPAETTPELLRNQPRFASSRVGAPQPKLITPELLGGSQLNIPGGLLGGAVQALTGLPAAAATAADALGRVHDRINLLDRGAQALGLTFDEYEKKLGEVDQKILAATRDTGNLSDAQQRSVLALRSLGLSYGDIAIKLGVSELAIKGYDEGLNDTVTRMRANTTETGKFQQELGKMIVGFDQAGKAVVGFHGVFRTDFDLPLAGAITDLAEVTRSTEIFAAAQKRTREALTTALATPTGLPNVQPVHKDLIDAARETETWNGDVRLLGQSLQEMGRLSDGALGDIAQDIVGIVRSFELAEKAALDFSKANTTAGKALALASGGAAVLGATGSGSTIGRVAGGALSGATLGFSVAGPIGAGVGAIAGGIVGLVRGLRDNDSEKQINGVRQAFVDAAGGLGELNKHAVEATGSLALVQSLLSAKNADQYNAAVKGLSDAFAAQDKRATDLADAVGGIVTAAQRVGSSVPKALQPALAKLIDMKGLTDDERQALKDLSAQGPDFGALEQKASDLGITLEQLGPKFQQQHIDTVAHSYQDAFDELTDAGGDVGGVLTGLSPKINALLSDATKFGVSVPLSMKPMLDKMLELGLLTDDSGKKLDTLAGFNFDDSKSPLDKSIETLSKAIDNLGNILKGLPAIAGTAASGIQGALDGVHPEIIVDVSFNDHGGYSGGGQGGGAEAAATGGRVTAFGIQRFGGGGRVLPFIPRGTDTVPAMLTPGEIVLNADQQAAVAAAMSQAGTSLSTAALERKLDALTRRLTDQNRRMPEAIAMQVKAAIAKAS